MEGLARGGLDGGPGGWGHHPRPTVPTHPLETPHIVAPDCRASCGTPQQAPWAHSNPIDWVGLLKKQLTGPCAQVCPAQGSINTSRDSSLNCGFFDNDLFKLLSGASQAAQLPRRKIGLSPR